MPILGIDLLEFHYVREKRPDERVTMASKSGKQSRCLMYSLTKPGGGWIASPCYLVTVGYLDSSGSQHPWNGIKISSHF